jgi:organic radical activating enzyme
MNVEYIGCNAKCWYCCQYQSERFPKLTTNDKSIIPAIKKIIKKTIELSKKENVKIGFAFQGGELTILDYDIQDELVEIINNLVDKGYVVTIFSNGILKDAPLLHTKASYLIHVIDWKNKKLEKKENVRYIIIFTEKDSIEDLEKFKKLNKDMPIDIVMNLTAPQNLLKNFYNKERNQMHKVRDKKHKIYLCRYNNYRSVGIIFYSSSKTYVYVGCCGSKALANDKIDTLNTTNIKKCPKTCIYAYNK